MLAQDVLNDVRVIYGACDDTRALGILSDAIELLANKGSWDPLERYVDLPVTGGLVVLPASVETPLRATINGVPAFARDRFYEFSLNGPGAGESSRPVAFAYATELETPFMVQPPALFRLKYAGDPGAGIYVTGEMDTGAGFKLLRTQLTTAYGPDVFSTVFSVEKSTAVATPNAICDVYAQASPTGGADIMLARYSAQDASPRFRRLKLSRPDATSIRLLCRMRTHRLTDPLDFIPLHSRQAILFMVQALRQYEVLNDEAGGRYEAKALQFLSEEQSARNAAAAVADTQQTDSALALNVYAPGMLTAGDVYDAFAEIYGPVGRQRIFDRIADAVETLANKTQWSSLVVYVVLAVQSDRIIALPADIESVLQLTIEGQPAFARDRFYEFSLNGPGSDPGDRVSVGYEDLGESALAVVISDPFGLRATASTSRILVDGTDVNGAFQRGVVVPTTGTTLSFTRVDRIYRDPAMPADQTVQVFASPSNTLVSTFGANETAPLYRLLRLSKVASGVRALCRRRSARIGALNDLIPLQSRLAVLTAGRALKKLAEGNAADSTAVMAQAVQMLQDEESSRHTAQTRAAAGQIDSALGINVYAPGMLTAGDLYDAFADIYGPIGRQRVFDRITDAVEALANKGAWNSLLVYVVLGVQNSYYVALPADIEAVLQATIEGQPAFARDRFYEFSLNGPGSADGDRFSVGWEDLGESPLAVLPAESFSLRANPDGVPVLVDGTDANGAALRGVVVPADGSTVGLFQRVDRLYRDPATPTTAVVQVFAMPSDTLVSTFGPGEIAPLYRRLRLSKVASGVRMLCRRRTARIGAFNDLIPLQSRTAVLTMGQALKVLAEGKPEEAASMQAQAVAFLKDEESSRHAAAALASSQQTDSALGLNVYAPGMLTAGDVYDAFAEIYGPVGRQRLLDRIGDAAEILLNKSNRNPLLIHVVLGVQNDYEVALPSDIESVLEANIEDRPAFARDRFYEFSLNGPGSDPGDRVATSWQDLGESALATVPAGSFSLRATASTSRILVDGTDVDGAAQRAVPVPTDGSQTLTFTRVDRLYRDPALPADQTVQVFAMPGDLLVSTFGANEVAPLYRRIRLSKKAQGVRMLCRRRTAKLTQLNDLIPLQSRLALLTMGRALRALANGDAGATDLETAAIRYLSEEQASREAHEQRARETQDGAVIGINVHAGKLVTAGDVYDAFAEIYGPVGRLKIFDRITDAVEALANLGPWSPLVVYVVLGVQNDYYVTLPADIESVLRATIEGQPAFARDRFYEFSLNGPGSDPGDRVSVGWEDQGDTPTAVQPSGDFRLRTGDGSGALRISGATPEGARVDDFLLTADAADCPLLRRLDAVVRDPADPGTATATLYAEPGAVLLDNLSANEVAPLYRRIRLSKKAQGARLLCRRRTAKICGFGDVIPLHSRTALLTMGRALKALAAGDAEGATNLKALAAQFLLDEESSRQAAQLEAGGQDAPAIGIPLHSRDVLTVGDLYDETARILGPVGRRRIFDVLSEAVAELQNKSAGGWDSQLGVVDLTGTGMADGVFVLPREVDEVLAVALCGRALSLRNRWMEFQAFGPLCGRGSGWRMCGEWEKVPGQSPVLRDITTPVRLLATLAAGTEDPEPGPLIIYGRDDTGAELYQDGSPGMRLPIRAAGTAPTTLAGDAPERLAPAVSAITRVLKPQTVNYVQLEALAADTLAPAYALGYYYPDRLEPAFRRIRVPARCQAAALRVAFRRRQELLTAFSDVIFLRSRRAVLSMVRALKLQGDGDAAGAENHEQLAVRALIEEQASRNPGESVSLQFAPESGFNEHGSSGIF